MSEPARDEQLIDLVDYLSETIARMDAAIGRMQADRRELATRLAALEAASDLAVLSAADDYERRVAENRPYEDAVGGQTLIEEAHRRFAP
jgi:hypothetical protein